ncbi:MAG: ribonuclease Z [Eubacteriales bacterium]|nr:ribonuclease Z [Eubacteriales bacterium]
MLDVCLLGTAGMVPLKNRWLTSLYVSEGNHAVLIDCGEGTQIALSEAGCRVKNIDVICITHFHQDHIGGLAGVLLMMSNANRTEDVTLIGPPGLIDVVQKLLVCASPSFRLLASETLETDAVSQAGNIEIQPFPVDHVIPCLGYTLTVHRKGKFDPDKAKKLGIPLNAWSILQRGESVKIDDQIIHPEQVIGPPRKGLKVLYSTDTRPADSIIQAGKNADLMILEGNYASDQDIEKAKKWKHMTFSEAAGLAKKAEAKELWLTHFSQSIICPEEFQENAVSVFPNTIIGRDGMQKTLKFEN